MQKLTVKLLVILAIMLAGVLPGNSQGTLPEEFKKSTLAGQIKYLNDHARIYQDYRAIREDMYRIFTRNTLDSLAKAKSKINTLITSTAGLETQIDSLRNSLQSTSQKLSENIRSKNSISLLGIQVNKHAYNTITWSIIAALFFLLIIGLISYKANRMITVKTTSDLDLLKAEFEAYRQKSRLDREQMARDHFNEIKRLRGTSPSSRT